MHPGPVVLGGSATAGIRARRQPTRDNSLGFQNKKLKLDFKTIKVLKEFRISKDKSRTLSPREYYGYNQVAYIVWLTSSTLSFSIQILQFKFCNYIIAAEVRLLSQLRESNLPVGDASRTLELKQWPT